MTDVRNPNHDAGCPRCRAPWSPRQVHGSISCFVCHEVIVAPGDDCERWQGDPVEVKAGNARYTPRNGPLYLPLRAPRRDLVAA